MTDDIVQAETFSDLLRAPTSPKHVLILPAAQSPQGMQRVESAFWDPSVGSPMTWLGRLTMHRAIDTDPEAVVSYQFLAPDVVVQEGERLANEQQWLALGSWFIGRMVMALGKELWQLEAFPEGNPRTYSFRREAATFGILDVTTVNGELTVPVPLLEAALHYHLIDHAGGTDEAVALASRWENELLPALQGELHISFGI